MTTQTLNCIEACQECAKDCEVCLSEMIGKKSHNDCPQCCQECIHICTLCPRIASSVPRSAIGAPSSVRIMNMVIARPVLNPADGVRRPAEKWRRSTYVRCVTGL